MDRGLYSATEFSDIILYVKRQSQEDSAPVEPEKAPIKPLEAADQTILLTKPKIRDVNDYLAVLQGGLSR